MWVGMRVRAGFSADEELGTYKDSQNVHERLIRSFDT